MWRFSNATPMDFEFQNGTGPIDGRSPFAQISSNAQRRHPGTAPTSPTKEPRESPTKSKPISIFPSSPSKSRPTSAYSMTPSKPLPAPPAAYNRLYCTPRKSRDDIDDSSAGETPRSPEHKDDSDATPDLGVRRGMSGLAASAGQAITGADCRSPTRDKERPTGQRRDSWFETALTRTKNKFFSPGRGELVRTDNAGRIEKSVARRRKREIDRSVARKRRHSTSDSDADADTSHCSPRKGSTNHRGSADRQHWLGSLFTFIGQHPTVPTILSFYAQLLFNVFLLSCCAYLFYCFWSAVQGDVDKKSHEAMADIMAEMAACAQQYQTNKCERATRLPALEMPCEGWARCMNRDARKVGRAKVSAHTFAEIFNSFVEPISYKAMLFTSILIFGCFAVSRPPPREMMPIAPPTDLATDLQPRLRPRPQQSTRVPAHCLRLRPSSSHAPALLERSGRAVLWHAVATCPAGALARVAAGRSVRADRRAGESGAAASVELGGEDYHDV